MTADKTYYVFIPGYRITAEVRDAPSTKHARTAFLDFLARQRRIPWATRAQYRKKMKAIKVQPGEIPATIVLDYDMPEPTLTLGEGKSPITEPILEEAPVQPPPPGGSEEIPGEEEWPQDEYFGEPTAPRAVAGVFDTPIARATRTERRWQ